MPVSSVSLPPLATALLAALGIWNVIVFLLMGYDKLQARRGGWRVSESTLLTCAAVFGAAGLWLGMQFFRHKTQHSRFRYGGPTLLVIQVALLVLLFARWAR